MRTKKKKQLPKAKPGVYVDPTLILWILMDIKAVWDEAGLGDNPDVSDLLYERLCAAIRELQA